MDFDGFYKQIKEGALGSVYLLTGEDAFIKERTIGLLVDTLQEATRQFNLEQLSSPEAGALFAACEQLPLMDERRIVIARDFGAFNLEAEGKQAAERVKNLPNTTTLVFVDRGSTPKKALYKAIEGLGGVVTIDALPPARAMRWAQERAQGVGCEIDRSAAQTLVMLTGGDTMRLATAVDMACDYVGEGRIDEAVLDVVLQSDPAFDRIKALNAFVGGDFAGGMAHVRARLREGGSGNAMSLLMTFSYKVRDLLEAKRMLDAGTSAAEAAKKLGGHPYAAQITVKEARRFSLGRLEDAVLAFADADYGVKNGEIDEQSALLLALTTAFAPDAPQ